MTVLRIDASIQGPNSASSELADLAEAEWLAVRPETTFVRRHVGADPVPADAWSLALQANWLAEEQRTDAQRAALELAGTLADELRRADAVILALPLYNWGVSQHTKSWIDLTIAGGSQGERLLDGKPAIVLTTRGGDFDLQLGTDVSIGYLTHDAETVALYMEETLTFLCYTAEASVALSP